MSIDPINSTRFTRPFEEVGEDGWKRNNTSYIVDAEDVDRFEKKIKFNEQNVRNSTVLVGLAVLATSFVKGKSIMKSVEKGGTFAAEYIAKAGAKVADVVTHGVQKLSDNVLKGRIKVNPVEYASKSEKIEKFFNGLRDKQVIENKAITEKFPNRIKEIFGEKTGQRAKAVIDGLGIKNTGDIARTAGATLIGYEAMDAITDKVEGVQDEKENRSALKRLIRPAIEIDNIVSNDSVLDILENVANVA